MMNLPDSKDEFWDGEVYVRKIVKDKHSHKFEQTGSREIKCKCGVGFFIGVGDKLKDGHLYHNDKFVI